MCACVSTYYRVHKYGYPFLPYILYYVYVICIGHYSKEDKEKMIEILRRMQEEDQNLGKFICIHKLCTVCDRTCGYGLQATVLFSVQAQCRE